ncbi:hypothetical protein GQ43DRAFT_494580 [Delitschia confertaspora ATCC 74209]|uniref:Rhodopsin domain-containing protein n=1 Tax=Delitschia confertaspora ATCC 74209 TaxID=1513339 RepID=A0A9P4JIS3_9PLEO|nr:hypothetical protein GQ43DRAFT_494580 [Delitschia confertaspora ATCC 74209]
MAPSAFFNEKEDAVATIKKLQFKTATTILFGIALLSVIARVVLKLLHRRKFSLDDYILFVGTACLIAGTGVLFYDFEYLYLGPAIQADPTLMSQLDSDSLRMLVNNEIKHLDAFFPLLWTTIFCVKFSFLAFFRSLIDNMKTITIYYRVTIALSVVSWAYIFCEPFIICPHSGAASVSCFQSPNTQLYAALIGTGTVMDSLTDLLIVSIPILILRRTRLKLRQRVAVGAFLCLSICMVIISIIRSSKIYGPPGVPIDTTWVIFWVHIEASSAVVMVSLTAFRTIFNQKKEERDRRERLKRPSNSWRKLASFRRKKPETTQATDNVLPSVPRATLTGLRTFIGGHNHIASLDTPSAAPSAFLDLESNEELAITALPHPQTELDGESWPTKPEWVHTSSP